MEFKGAEILAEKKGGWGRAFIFVFVFYFFVLVLGRGFWLGFYIGLRDGLRPSLPSINPGPTYF